jgi:acylphosphatase
VAATRFLVSGRVQGVFFRASTRQQALELGLRGQARNLPDGRVEVLAAGDVADVEALARWLQQGPPMAKVVSVERSGIEEAAIADGFTIC